MSGALVSLGYEGRSAEELISYLVELKVAVLVDVRLTPLSRKPGLSKVRLSAALAGRGIRYVHLPALGNPKDNRAPFRAGDPASRQRFRELLTTVSGERALSHVAELLDGQTVALLCFEREHTSCHRYLVVERIQASRPAVSLVSV